LRRLRRWRRVEVRAGRLTIVCFKADPQEVKKLDRLASILKANRSALIRRAIRELIEKYEKPYEGKIKIYGEKL
jgi:predicted transcriptional regulator